ncbi:MAG TPA: D-amino acid aminotransferase [Tepidisphaeraceae bacterium]|jgi:D-alanine transaminase|nr:D-amino acid aminotransferase [Tepidisphaeraceae bacterium]
MPTEWIWLNGKTLPLSEARIGVEDRGFQFADGVYEVIRLYNGVPFTLAEHLQRLVRSAAAIDIALPLDVDKLDREIRNSIAQQRAGEGMIYLQLTRGCAPRNHVIPADISATLLFYFRPLPPVAMAGRGKGARIVSVPDERWKRCWIKSIALLPNILAKTQAVSGGYDEAVFIDDDIVTECSASNLFVVMNGALVTHPVGPKVLPGITRAVLLELARELGIVVEERPIRQVEAMAAAEIFITSTTREITWVKSWNDKPAGGERCGPVTLALHQAFQERVRNDTKGIPTSSVIAKSA